MEDRGLPKQNVEAIRDAIARLFAAVEKLSQVRVVLMDYSEQWQIRNHLGKELLMQCTPGNPPPALSNNPPIDDPGEELLVQWTSDYPPSALYNNPPVKFVESCCDYLFTEDLNDWDNDWFVKQVMASFAEGRWPETHADQLGWTIDTHQSHDASRGVLSLQQLLTTSNHTDHTQPAAEYRSPIAKD